MSDRHRGSPVIDRDRSLHSDAWTVVMHRESDGLRGGIATHLNAWISIRRWTCHRMVECHRAVDTPHDHGVLDRVIAIVHSLEAIGRLAVVAEVF